MNELRTAQQVTQAVLDAAVRAELERRPDLDFHDVAAELTAETIEVLPPYAREYRALLGAVAARHHVQAVSTPRLGPHQYRRGADVLLLGLPGGIAGVRREWATVGSLARTLFDAVAAGDGEDVATHRASLLLGYRLGLSRDGLDREQVEAIVGGKVPGDGVTWKSTGSGAWDGYLAARADADTIAAEHAAAQAEADRIAAEQAAAAKPKRAPRAAKGEGKAKTPRAPRKPRTPKAAAGDEATPKRTRRPRAAKPAAATLFDSPTAEQPAASVAEPAGV
ncbi:hypothetical protein [Saccharothrix sp. HUAS TT1]|uniref:hypothetical protein n=1 Tax=unclassified Saccharothrix TaxID=2593673 RepID=UPI00345C4671